MVAHARAGALAGAALLLTGLLAGCGGGTDDKPADRTDRDTASPAGGPSTAPEGQPGTPRLPASLTSQRLDWKGCEARAGERPRIRVALLDGPGAAGLHEARRRDDRDRADPQEGREHRPPPRLDAVRLRRARRLGSLDTPARGRLVRQPQLPLRPGGLRPARGRGQRGGELPHRQGAGDRLPEGRHDPGHGGGGGGVPEGRRGLRRRLRAPLRQGPAVRRHLQRRPGHGPDPCGARRQEAHLLRHLVRHRARRHLRAPLPRPRRTHRPGRRRRPDRRHHRARPQPGDRLPAGAGQLPQGPRPGPEGGYPADREAAGADRQEAAADPLGPRAQRLAGRHRHRHAALLQEQLAVPDPGAGRGREERHREHAAPAGRLVQRP